MDEGEHSARADVNIPEQPVELLVVPDGQLQMSRDDSDFLV